MPIDLEKMWKYAAPSSLFILQANDLASVGLCTRNPHRLLISILHKRTSTAAEMRFLSIEQDLSGSPTFLLKRNIQRQSSFGKWISFNGTSCYEKLQKSGPTLSGQSQGRDMQVGRRGTWARGVAKKPLNGKLVTLAYVMRCCLKANAGHRRRRRRRRNEFRVCPTRKTDWGQGRTTDTNPCNRLFSYSTPLSPPAGCGDQLWNADGGGFYM